MFFFFFFQAEDGIRDLTVTGVQTCALPIFGAEAAQHGAADQRGVDIPLAQRGPDERGRRRLAVGTGDRDDPLALRQEPPGVRAPPHRDAESERLRDLDVSSPYALERSTMSVPGTCSSAN